jgi:hypothetical protein
VVVARSAWIETIVNNTTVYVSSVDHDGDDGYALIS